MEMALNFGAGMGEILRRIPAEDRKCWKYVVEDSYEMGGQNFTDDFLQEFQHRYGYDPLPYLPVYEGYVVQSEEASDRFLWDLRRLIADKVAYDYVGGLRDISHKHDIKTLLKAFNALVAKGHTVIIIEHNLEVIKCADYVIDLGPEGGKGGGNIVCCGTPEEIVKCKASYTGKYLKEKLS